MLYHFTVNLKFHLVKLVIVYNVETTNLTVVGKI